MSEERAAQAALAIERYVTGLRAELEVLKPEESAELTREISTMLVDAARNDPEQAFAEMERLGEPWRLAGALLAERGVPSEGGIPSVSWWRMGVAATVDILVGFAFPVAVIISVYANVWSSLFGPYATQAGTSQLVWLAVVVALLLGVSAWLAWRTWAPWRTGGRATTPGMSLARISVVRLGGTRTVVRDSDLAAAGLEAPTRSLLSAGVSVAVAILIVSWSLGMVSGGALDPLGQGAVSRLAGSLDEQEQQVDRAVTELYDAAMTTAGEARAWPAMSQNGLDDAFRAALVKRFSVTSDSGGGGYRRGDTTNAAAGVWTAFMTEIDKDGAEHSVTLTYTLRVDWSSGGGPEPAWVLTDYEPRP